MALGLGYGAGVVGDATTPAGVEGYDAEGVRPVPAHTHSPAHPHHNTHTHTHEPARPHRPADPSLDPIQPSSYRPNPWRLGGIRQTKEVEVTRGAMGDFVVVGADNERDRDRDRNVDAGGREKGGGGPKAYRWNVV